jgi:hypothetical protein
MRGAQPRVRRLLPRPAEAAGGVLPQLRQAGEARPLGAPLLVALPMEAGHSAWTMRNAPYLLRAALLLSLAFDEHGTTTGRTGRRMHVERGRPGA